MHLQFLQGIIGFDDDEEEEEELGEDDEEEGEEEEEEEGEEGGAAPSDLCFSLDEVLGIVPSDSATR